MQTDRAGNYKYYFENILPIFDSFNGKSKKNGKDDSGKGAKE